jgi:hypothetical protein
MPRLVLPLSGVRMAGQNQIDCSYTQAFNKADSSLSHPSTHVSAPSKISNGILSAMDVPGVQRIGRTKFGCYLRIVEHNLCPLRGMGHRLCKLGPMLKGESFTGL